jgi:hypothetical protein
MAQRLCCSFAVGFTMAALATAPPLPAQIAVPGPPSSPQNALTACGSTRSLQATPPRWSPLPNNVRNLRSSEVRELLGDHFLLVSTMEQLPSTMLADFASIWGEPFAAVDPGCPMSPDFLPGSHRQLVFAAFSRDTAILVFVSGGFVDTLNVAVLTHAFRGGVWKAFLTDLPTEDIDGLRTALRGGTFVNTDRFQRPRHIPR